MRKNLFVFFIFIFMLLGYSAAWGQSYTVIYFTGTVYFQNKPIAIGQQLKSTQQLSAATKDAFVCFLHPKEGKVSLDFLKGKPRQVSDQKDQQTELYELTIQDFIHQYNSPKMPAVRGFDYVDYLRSFPNDTLQRLLVFDQDTIPLTTQKQLRVLPGNQFIACLYHGKDSLCNPLPLIDSSYLILDQKALGLTQHHERDFIWMLKFSFKEGNRPMLLSFQSGVYHSHLMTQNDLKQLIRIFRENIKDGQSLKEEIFAHLNDFYGRFHQETVEREISEVLAKNK